MRHSLRGKWLVIVVVLLCFLALQDSTRAAEKTENSNRVTLQILTVNDFHGALMENGKNPGAAKLVELLKEEESANPEGTLILSAGDMFQGSPDSNLLQGKPVIDIMNYVPFTAMTLGNHEFDWGLDVLKARMAQAKFPFVCANILDRKTGKPVDFIAPYCMVERKGLKIAIIGLATPETAYKANPKLVSGYIFEDPVKVVNALVPKLKKSGADMIIVLTHLSSWMDQQGNITGDAAVLAQQAKGIDAVVSGHSHQTVSGKVNGIPVVQANNLGRAAGNIELVFDTTSRRVVDASVNVTTLPQPGLTADSNVEKMLAKEQAEVAPIKNTVVGKSAHELSHDRGEYTETILGQWVTDVMRQAAGADIAFENSGGLRTSLHAGAITMGNLYEVMPFDNTLVTVDMTGKQVLDVLKHGIMNQKIGMVQYSGMKIRYSPEAEENSRFVITMPDGQPLQMDKIYKVVTNDFMASGGDGYTTFSQGKNVTDTELPLRDIIADALKKAKVVDFSGDDRWQVQKVGAQPAA